MLKQKKLVPLASLILVFLLIASGCSKGVAASNSKNLNEMKVFHESTEKQKQASDNMYNYVKKLSEKDSARMSGFDEETPYIEFVSNEFKNAGLAVKTQEFPVTVTRATNLKLEISTPEKKSIDGKYWAYGIGTPPNGLHAEVVSIGEGLENDIKATELKGKIALIKRGNEPVFQKVGRAASAGAIAVLFYKENSDDLTFGTLVRKTEIPAVLIKSENAKELEKAISANKKASAFIDLAVEMKDSLSKNIIAETDVTNKYPNAKTLIIGAHLDSVDTPGANDNASGVSVLLEAAKMLSTLDLKCNVRFIAFGSEEINLVGSTYYVKNLKSAEWGNIIGMINLDMVGQGSIISIGATDPNSKYPMLALAEEQLKMLNYHFQKDSLFSSDSAPFEEAKIQVVYFENTPYTELHTDGDTIEKIKPEMLLKTLETVMNMSVQIGENPEKYLK